MAKSSKSSLAITRGDFRADAKPITVVINGKEMTAAAKEFSTGSLGWNINDKLQVEIGGKMVTCQVGLNLTIVGSKDLPDDGSAPLPTSKPPADKPAAEPPADAEPDAAGQASF